MKIGIHHRPGSFSDRWIEHCRIKEISYKIVNAYDSDIVHQLEDCDIFLWHHHQDDYRDVLFAKTLLYSLQKSGKKVFPDFNTTWHFDDKVGQKYYMESIGAPIVPSYVFYSKKEAIEWIDKTSFPKVFKLRGGAGSSNVSLVKSKKEAKKLVNKAFSNGFSHFNKRDNLNERIRKYREGKSNLLNVLKGVARLFITSKYLKLHNREKGYIYFQDYIPNNKYDIRIIIVGDKAFGIKRMVRNNDFRASGSGNIIYDKSQIDEMFVSLAFRINKQLKTQSIAFDFIVDDNKKPLIVEISYGYAVFAYDMCEGYWDSTMKWHEELFNPQEWMIENLISSSNNTQCNSSIL